MRITQCIISLAIANCIWQLLPWSERSLTKAIERTFFQAAAILIYAGIPR